MKDTTYYGSYIKNIVISLLLNCFKTDAEKAFDSVNQNFLYRALHTFCLHETVIKTIQSLYDYPTARLKVNRCLSNRLT